MSSRVTIRRTAFPNLRPLLNMVNGLFPPGSPISTSTFLDGVTKLLQSEMASLVLVRTDERRRMFVVVQGVLHTSGSSLHTKFNDQVHDEQSWTRDAIAQRLYARCMRRPENMFGYSTRQWLARMDHQQSFSRDFLDHLHARQDLSAVRTVDERIFSILTVYRTNADAQAFTRHERKLLTLVHDCFRERIIDLRARRLREELPRPVRATFSLLLAGHTEKEIAKLTHKSPNTVHDHVKRIYQHFHVGSRAQLLACFVDVERMREYRV